MNPVDRLSVHELSAVNGHSLRFKCRATLRIPIVQTKHLPADLPRIDLASNSLDDSRKLVSRNGAGSFRAVFGVRRWIPV